MVKYLVAGLLLLSTACLEDPKEILDDADLRVTVLGIDPGADAVEVRLERASEIVEQRSIFSEGLDLDVYFPAFRVGIYLLVIETKVGPRRLQCHRAEIENRSGPDQQVIELNDGGECTPAALDQGSNDADSPHDASNGTGSPPHMPNGHRDGHIGPPLD